MENIGYEREENSFANLGYSRSREISYNKCWYFHSVCTVIAYYKSVLGVVLMYSITDRKSFDGIAYWLKSLDENCKAGICRVLVGNKKDLNESRQVSYDEGKAVADKHKMMFYETSAKTGESVEEVFTGITEEILTVNSNIVVASDTTTLNTKKPDKNAGGCC